MSPTLYRREIADAAAVHGLDRRVVAALIQVESGGNPFAWNPEPRYRYLWNVREGRPFRPLTPAELMDEIPPRDFPVFAGDRDQEWWGQQASWGLMQVMGALAREYGYRAPYLTELVSPAANLGIGCRHLAALLKWAEGDLVQALAAWNGGKAGNTTEPFRNEGYAAKVLMALSGVED